MKVSGIRTELAKILVGCGSCAEQQRGDKDCKLHELIHA
jgi:hypothetical protein